MHARKPTAREIAMYDQAYAKAAQAYDSALDGFTRTRDRAAADGVSEAVTVVATATALRRWTTPDMLAGMVAVSLIRDYYRTAGRR